MAKKMALVFMMVASFALCAEAQQLFNPCTVSADELSVNPDLMAISTTDMGKDDIIGVTFWIYQEQATNASVTVTYTKGEMSRVEGTTDCYAIAMGQDIKRDLVLETRYRVASALRAIDPAKSSVQSAMSNPFILRVVVPPVRYAPPTVRVGAKS